MKINLSNNFFLSRHKIALYIVYIYIKYKNINRVVIVINMIIFDQRVNVSLFVVILLNIKTLFKRYM